MKTKIKISFAFTTIFAVSFMGVPFLGLDEVTGTFTQVTLGVFLVYSSAMGFYWSLKAMKEFEAVKSTLLAEADHVVQASLEMEKLSARLSESTNQQAASLQETVASVDEIAAMVARNADSAQNSARIADKSTKAAETGKSNTESMLRSIESISEGNDEMINQMQASNAEITEIVKVIQEIGLKTQVINDIVFQTKLLSFNASVEAARAGENGKGFAVVAEEVGNLASMSGNAAKEISDLLNQSVHTVTEIVEKTKTLMDNMIRQSREKVAVGTETAKECSKSLEDILRNVSSVDDMVKEIANASKEQSVGIIEINKAMSELDQTTQSNASVAVESLRSATELQLRARKMKDLLGGQKVAQVKAEEPAVNNVVTFERKQKPVFEEEQPMKKAAGMEFSSAPSKNDPRFEDV